MKKLVILISISILFAMLSAEVLTFNETDYYPNVIVAGFSMEAVGNREGIISHNMKDGVVETGISSFDRLAQNFRFNDLEQTVTSLKNLDWNDNGIYPRCIYRIFLEENTRIEEAILALQADSNIIFAEYDPIMRQDYVPNDPSYSNQWHHEYIMSELAWDYTTGSEDILIGIVDSGIKWNHPDLQDNIWINEPELNSTSGGNAMSINWANGTVSGGNGIDDDGNGKIDDCIGWNFYSAQSNQSYQDWPDNDHGTHVGGCAGAVGDNMIGVVGSMMNVKLIVSRHAPTNVSSSSIYNGNNGIYYCADSGADVINCSWGGTGGGTSANTAVNYAVDQGSLVLCAAGNDNLDVGITPHYPGNATNAVCVAATGPNGDQKASFSNFGDPVDISAPGDNIYSTVVADNGYASYGGTSMACPVAAGVAGLIKSLHPDLGPMELKERLEDTCDNIDVTNPDYIGMLGAGRVNSFTGCLFDLIPDIHILDSVLSEQSGDGDGLPNPGEVVNMMLQITNSENWLTANDLSATITCENPDVTILNEYGEFPNTPGTAVVWNTGNPFQFETSADISNFNLVFIVTFDANAGTAWPYAQPRELIVEITLDQPGWPISVGGASASAGVIIDLEDNGSKEIIFGDQAGNLHIMNAAGEDIIDPIAVGGTISAAVAVGDITGDAVEEIVVGTESNHVLAYSNSGSLIFDYDCGGQVKGNPIIADVDDNGTNEIIAYTFIGGQVHVINGDGTVFANFPAALSGGVLSSSAVGDINGDGNLEIILATLTGALDVIETSTGSQLAGFPFALGMGSWHGPIVGNVDGDAEPEIIVGTLGSKVMVVNHDGTLLSETSVSGQVKTSVATADFNNDDTDEMAFVASNGDVYIIDSAGNTLPNFPVSVGTLVESSPVLCDMDANGTIDIVFGDNLGFLHSIDITGSETAGFPIDLGSTIKTSPAIGDVDADGDIEILVPNQSSYVLIDYKNSVGQIAWANFKRNPQRIGNSFYATTGINPGIVSAFANDLGRNYPNPFNPTTNISYTIAEDSFVELAIYNVKGQLVKTLITEQKNAGVHNASWNGVDKTGKNVSSGIYFYKMRAGGRYTNMRKMIMLK